MANTTGMSVPRAVVLGAVLVVGFGLGSWWQERRGPAPEQPYAGVEPPNLSSDAGGAEPARRPQDVQHREVAPFAGDPAVPQTVDLAEGLRATANIESEFAQSAAFYALTANLDSTQIEYLLDESDTVLTGRDYLGATAILIGRLAELDLATAVERMLSASGRVRSQWLHTIFHSAARIDLDGAVEAAAQLPKNQRRRAANAILGSVQNLSQARRADIVATLGVKNTTVTDPTEDPRTAWDEAMALTRGGARQQQLGRIAMVWARDDPQAALAAVDALPPSMSKQGLVAQVVMSWSRQEPDAALEWLNGQPVSEVFQQIQGQIVATVAASDPTRAQFLVDSMQGVARDRAELGLRTATAAGDVEGTADWVAAMEDTDLQQQAIMSISATLASQSADAAERFLDRLPEEQRQSSMVTMMLAMSNPQLAASRALQVRDPAQRIQQATAVVQAWSRADPRATERWIGQRDSEMRAPLYGSLVGQLAQTNLDEARRLVDKLARGAERDAGIGALVGSRKLGTAEAERLLDEISDPEARAQHERVLEMTGRLFPSGY